MLRERFWFWVLCLGFEGLGFYGLRFGFWVLVSCLGFWALEFWFWVLGKFGFCFVLLLGFWF